MEERKVEKTNTESIGKRFLNYLIKTLNGMAYGLFSTLIIGTIVKTVGDLTGWNFLIELSVLLKNMTGIGIGVGVAWSLKLEGLRLVAAGVAGGIATGLKIGDPMVAYLCVVASIEGVGLLYRGLKSLFGANKTPFDIILIPLLSAIIAYGVFKLINVPVKSFMDAIGTFITRATELQPLLMGVIIAVVMGMALTAPISSAAIAISIGLGGIAGGAAVVGCSVQMVGFAVMSRKDNNIGTVLSVGVGTSMLQFKNILRKPIIWLPTILVSAVLGPLATLWLQTQTVPSGSGMGTAGLVGQIATFEAMGNTTAFWLSVLLLQVLFPIILVYVLDVLFRRYNLIKTGDLKI